MSIVNASAKGSLKNKSVIEVKNLFQKISENGCTWPSDRRLLPKKQVGFLEVGTSTNFETQLATLTHKMNVWKVKMRAKPLLACGLSKKIITLTVAEPGIFFR